MRNVQTVQLRKKMKKRSGAAAIVLALVLFLSLQFSRAAIRYTGRKAEFNVRKEHLDAAENIFFLTIKLGDETPRYYHNTTGSSLYQPTPLLNNVLFLQARAFGMSASLVLAYSGGGEMGG